MSGAAGGTRIPRAAVEQTVKDFVTKVLSKIPGFKSAKISGSYNQPVKQDFGDIDLVVSIEGDKPKKEVKKMIVDYFEGLSDKELPYLNTEKHRGKKAINHGEIITNLYPISGMPGEFVQIDNIIAVSESEGDFKKVVLDYPAEIQGLILGLVKTPLLEEDPEQVFKRMGIKDVPSLGPNQEYEFHLDTSGLSLKIVTLDENYRQLDSNIVWESSDWNDVKRLLKDFNLDGTFDQFIEKIKKFKNPRSKNRVKGFFKTSIKVGPAEQGTPKGDGKQNALDTVAALEEKYGSFAVSLIKPLLLEQEGTIAIFPGKFKPPHKDHLARIQAAAKVADQVRVIIAPNPVARPDEAAVSAQESLAIFNLYKKKNLVPDNVTFEISDINSPVSKAYKEFEANPDQKYIAVFGKEESAKFKGTDKLPNVTINQFPEANIGKANASDLRTAIAKNDIVRIKDFIPFGVSPAEYLDALNMPVKEPMSEGKSIKKLRVFDFDDTLAHIKALIRITHQDGSKEELTPAEYAVYNPQPGDKFNFSDFNKVIRQAHPIENNVQDLIRSYNDPTEKTTILTARMLGYPVKKYLRDEFGIEPYVVGLGSADPMDKARWIEQQIHKGYNDIEFRDDSKKNVDAVATLQDKYPDVRLTSMLVESYKGKRTSDGAPGTFKAKITKAYGGDVTIEKARKFKNRENATPHDKRQANWFINFHSKNEGLNEENNFHQKALSQTEEEALELTYRNWDTFGGKECNNGFCDIFAKNLSKYLPGSKIMSTEDPRNNTLGHVWVEYEGKYFDAETPNGVDSWKQLPWMEEFYAKNNSYPSDIENLNEVGEANLQPYKWEEVARDSLFVYVEFTTDSGIEYDVDLESRTYTPENSTSTIQAIGVEFAATIKDVGGYTYSTANAVVNKGEMYRVMSTMADILRVYSKKLKAKAIIYSPSKKQGEEFGSQRDLLYKAFIKKAIPNVTFEQRRDEIIAVLPTTTVQERKGEAAPYGSGYELVEEQLTPYIVDLTKHMFKQGLTIDPAPEIEFVEDEDNAKNPLGKTAYYDPNNRVIVLYVTGRHPKDILRSFAHEMIHHCQNLEGRLGNIQTTNVNEDDYLKSLEREAYERGNMSFRSWENSLRGDNGVRYIKGFAPGDHNDEPIMAEGRYDSLTNKLSKLAFAAFKDIHDRGDKKGTFSFIVGPKSEYEEEQPDIQSDEFEFDFNGIVVITKDLYVVDGGANAGFDNEGDEIQPVIELKFKIPKNPDWQKVSFDIKDVVRHELEHLTQDGLNLKGYVDIDDPRAQNDPKLTRLGKYMEDDQFFRDQIDMGLLPKANYFRLQKEIDAMLQGMYFKAKKSRQPFADVLNNYLDMQSISEEDKENILNLWRNRAKSLSLPKF